MKTLFTIIMVLATFSGVLFAKTMGPIKGSLVPAKATAAVGETVALTLMFETTTPFKAVEVKIKLPPGVKLVKGSPVTEIANFKPGEKRELSYKVRVRKAGEQRIIATVNAKGLGPNEAFGNAFASVINPAPANDDTVVTTDSDGTKIIVNGVP